MLLSWLADKVLAARYDRVTPRAPRERRQARCSVTRVHEFERGHTMLPAALERSAARSPHAPAGRVRRQLPEARHRLDLIRD